MEEEIKGIKTRRTRVFLGKLDNFESKEERNFEKAHLKAYLKGKRFFYQGFMTNKFGGRERVPHLVKQDLFNI